MDISCGSTRVSKFSPHVTEAVVTAKYRQSSIYSEEQNQSQRPAAPTQSGAQKFKIRSAKEKQELITKSSSTWRELFDKARRSSKESREEMTSVHHISPPSLQTNMITQRRPSDLNQLGLANKVELSISPETSHRSQKKLENVESPTTTVGGRTGWRQAYLSNRSESLDWKGLKMKENQTNAISNTKDLDERSMRRSESLQHNRPNVSEPAHPSKKVSLYVHPFSGPGHKQQDSNGPISPPGSGRSPVRMVALAQSFPSRIKVDQGQYKTEERKSSWYSGHSGTKSEPAKYHLRSEATPSNITITRSHSLMDKNGHTFLEDNSDARPGVLHGIINPVPFFSSVDRNISVSSLSKMKTISYEPEKRGAFPKVPLKKEQQHFSTIAYTSLVLPEGTDNSVPTLSKEKLLSQDAVSSMTNNNIFDNRRLTGNSIGLGTQSSVRTRHRHFTAPAFSANCLSNINRTEKSTKNETETQDEKTITNLKLTKGVDAKIIPGKHPHSAEEGVIGLTKSQSSQSLTGDSGQISPSSGNPTKKNEGLLEEVRNPYLASVRNTIHKFEALAQQSQSSSVIQPPRRAFSVIEKPKVTASLNKAYSNSSLGKRWGDWNREFLKEDLFNKSDVSNDAAMTIHDQSGAIQATTQDKEKTTLKTQSREVKSLEPETVQTVKQPDELPSEQKYGRFTMLNKNKDELDSSIINKSVQTPKTIDLSENKFRDYLSSTVSHSSLMSFVIANVSHAELKDPELKKKMFTKDEAFQKESTSTPQNSHSTTKIKRPSYLFSDSGVIPSIQALSDLSNPYSTIKDKKGAEKVIRWIMDKGADDENGEDCIDDEDDDGTEGGYDSDSGESSVTITSNMSNRSFSMSLLDLCSLGGLDLPPLDGSKDDENWMAKRTVSMSSDVSALSAVTLLGMDELECLLNDVRGLDDDALENYEDVHVVVLHKEAGSGLGFTVAGGVDQNKPVTVHKVLPNGLAAHEGSIHEGDQVLSINGTALHNSTHMEALHTMRKTKGRAMAVVVIRRGDVTDTCCSLKDSPQKAAGNPGSRVRVLLNKSSSDLGFSLEGGVGSPLGDKPLTVQRLFQGGPVGKVFPGDELLEVEGQSLEGLRRLEVWHLIKRLPPGHVEVLLQRPYQ